MDQRLIHLLERQAGIVTRAQVRACGLTDDWLAHHVASRRWQRVDRGVYSATTGSLTDEQRHWTAVLRCGDSAALAGRTAIGVWIPRQAKRSHEEGERLTIAIDERRRIDTVDGVDVWLVQNLDKLVHPAREPRRMRLEEAVLMTASRAPSHDDAVGLLADVCGSRCTKPTKLLNTLQRLPSNLRFRPFLRDLLDDIACGAYSYLEVHYLRDVERPHGLPTGKRQRRVVPGARAWYRDVEYVGFDVVAELDGRLGHEQYADRADDMDRDNVTVIGGAVTTRVGYRHVLHRACESAALVGGLLSSRGWRGELRRCGPRCQLP